MSNSQSKFFNKHVLIIVENLPVPFDKRVWQEANTLKDNGAKVSIICPKMKNYTKSFENINGIEIYRHPLPIEAKGATGYLAEYIIALFWESFISLKIFMKKRFHVIQGCNPPDLIFIVAFFFKIFGVKYVFDHHDINPELYIAKFGKKGFMYKVLLWVEKMTFKMADYSIATNESYKSIAVERGKMPMGKVQIVRSGPNLDRLKITNGNNKYKNGRTYLVGYVGVIGEQEGLDLLLESICHIVTIRKDIQFAIVGDGTELEKIKKTTIRLGIDGFISFYGRVEDSILMDILNSTDLCVNPDRPTIMNNLSTMNKIMEYMALRKPIVQYDLKEGRFSAKQASLYAENTNPKDFAEKVLWLINHPKERDEMAEYGYRRVVEELSWEFESKKLIDLYTTIFAKHDLNKYMAGQIFEQTAYTQK